MSSASERYEVRAKNFGKLYARFAAQFDRDREDRDPPAPVPEASAEPPLHPNRCGPCEDCAEALADYATIPAYLARLKGKPASPTQEACDDCGTDAVESVISRRSRLKRMGRPPKQQRFSEKP